MRFKGIFILIMAAAFFIGGMHLLFATPDSLAKTVRGDLNITTKITVTAPRSGDVKTRGGYLMVFWKWYKNGADGPSASWEPLGNFRVRIVKGKIMSKRSVVVDLGTGHNEWTDGGGMYRIWLIPSSLRTGSEFIAEVTHVPSGAKGMAGFFTIR